MADTIIEWAEMFYNEQTKKRVLFAIMKRLNEYIAKLGIEVDGE